MSDRGICSKCLNIRNSSLSLDLRLVVRHEVIAALATKASIATQVQSWPRSTGPKASFINAFLGGMLIASKKRSGINLSKGYLPLRSVSEMLA